MKLNLKSAISAVKLAAVKHSPAILTGIGITGMLTAGVMAVKTTPKALRLIEEASLDEENEIFIELKPVEKAKAAWKCYIPSAITASVSIACIIGASAVHTRRNAALATAYALSESTLREYGDKVVETIGEKKERTIRDAVAQDQVKKNPPENNEVIITGKGETLCYDPLSGRYFKGDIDKIKRAENDINRRLRDEMAISLNEFYYELGLRETLMGDELGWNIDRDYMELHFTSMLTDNGQPCLVVGHINPPQYGFDR